MTGSTRAAGERSVSPDRVDLDLSILAGLTAGVSAVCGISAHALLGRAVGSTLAVAIGALAGAGLVLGPRRISVRLVARVAVVFTAVAQMRLGVLGDSLVTGSQTTVAWLAAALVVFVLTDLVDTTSVRPMRGWTPPPVRGPAAVRTVSTVAVLLLFVVVVAPLVLPFVTRSTRIGQGPRLDAAAGGGGVLVATDSLDMTTRPDLGDEVVFTVTADRGTFWRGQTYDAWDGRRWTRTSPQRLPLDPDGRVVPSTDDLGASGTEVITQRIRIEAAYSDVVFAAASPVSVDARQQVLQGSDGTLVTGGGQALGRGASYTVVSRRPVLDEQTLRAATGPVPEPVTERYASMPVTTDRVVTAAREATAGATNDYDRIRALERWMGERTEYSLDAPLSPVGVDVVDHFLFESRLGWCEQVASSLVVMARINGIPARLVTGFVPGELDRVSGAYVVRGYDAHAWAEVWFPDVGWVAFDPTAEVPLAGSDPGDRSLAGRLLDHAVVLLVAAATVGVIAFLGARWLRARRERRDAGPVGWAARTDARLSALGEAAGWPRAGFETASRFARSLALHLHDERLVEVGRAIDADLYAPVGPDEAERARVDQILDTVDVSRARSPEPVGVGAGTGATGPGPGRRVPAGPSKTP